MGWTTSNYGMDLDRQKRMGKIARKERRKIERAEAKEKKAGKLDKKAERKNKRAARLEKRAERKMGKGKMGKAAKLAGTIRIQGDKTIQVEADHTLKSTTEIVDLFEKIL